MTKKLGNVYEYLAGESTSRVIPLVSGSITLTNELQAAGFLGANNAWIFCLDLADISQVRLTSRVTTASASANTPRLQLLYSTTLAFSTTFSDYATIGESVVENSMFTGQTNPDSGWINLVKAARINSCYVALGSQGGDGAADPVLANILLHLR